LAARRRAAWRCADCIGQPLRAQTDDNHRDYQSRAEPRSSCTW
jgi:hypothetical protein